MTDFNILFYSSPSPMWVFDVATLQILEVNEAAVKEYGYSKEEFLTKTIIELRPEEDGKLVKSILPQIRASQTHFREFRHKSKSGRVFYVELMSHPIVFKGTESRLVVIQNIEEKKAMAGRLAITQAKLIGILETTSIGYFQVDHNDTITFWNKAAENMIGYDRKYVIGKNMWELFPEAIDTKFYVQYQKALVDRVNQEFTAYFWPVQKWFAIIIYFVNEGLVIHFRDITESKIYEEKLLKNIEQLKEISYLNSHYMRKPVASLLGLTSLINNNLVTGDEYKELAMHIEECSLELDGIIRQVNSKVNAQFGNFDHEEVKNFSLNGMAEQVIAELHMQESSHKIVLKYKSEINCYGDEQSIAGALKQLLYNAINFSPGADKVEVSLEIVNQNAIVSVHDFGIGIDQKMLDRIFMGFNKKSVAKELGTGLSKVSDVAQRHNGNVWVESEPGKGAVFSMRLPMSNIGLYKHIGSADFPNYNGPGIHITYDTPCNCIVAEWEGFHSRHSVKAGCLKMLKIIADNNAKYILNDNTSIIGTWNEAVEWVANHYFPMLHDAGVTHVAWVYSPSTFSRLSVDMTIAGNSTTIMVETFEDVATAENWLKDVSSL